jgi:hypothetical protein
VKEYPFLHRWDPARYAPTYLRQGILEVHVQAAIVAYLRTRWRAEVSVIDVGSAKLRGQASRLLAYAGGDPRFLKGRGDASTRGIVDLAVTFRGGRAGWFEVKRPAHLVTSKATGRLVQKHPAGAPTEAQLTFLGRQHNHGALVGVLWAPKDLDSIVETTWAT